MVPIPPTPARGQTPAEGAGGHKPAAWGSQIPLWTSASAVAQGVERGPRAPLPQHCPPCSSSSGNPKPVGLWHSTSPLPVEEDGFHQGDHIPARVVPGTHNRNVQELPRDKWSLFETGPPLQDPVSSSLEPCNGERLHNPALSLGKEAQR